MCPNSYVRYAYSLQFRIRSEVTPDAEQPPKAGRTVPKQRKQTPSKPELRRGTYSSLLPKLLDYQRSHHLHGVTAINFSVDLGMRPDDHE